MISRTILNLLYTILCESQQKSLAAEILRTADDIPAYMYILIFIGTGGPFYKANFAFIDFQAGDGAGMDAGAAVGITPTVFTVGQGRSVGMPGDEMCLVQLCPSCYAFLNYLTFAVVSGGARRVLDSGKLKRPP